MPDKFGLVILIRSAILSLAQANDAGNYSLMRDLAAPGFQQATTAASLAANFADLRSLDLDLSEVAIANPSLVAPPAVDERGFLRLAGFFPVRGQNVNFDLIYQVVDNHWRLFGIGASLAKPADGKVVKPTPAPVMAANKLPDNAVMVKMIRNALTALNQANATGDYSVLRETASEGFQKANSAAKLSELFANLRSRNLDLSPVTVIDPRLFRPPAIDEKGYLRLTGFFPSRPEQVNFDLAFAFSAGVWELYGIGVNTSVEAAPAADASANAPPSGASPANAAPAAGKDGKAPPVPRLSPPGQ